MISRSDALAIASYDSLDPYGDESGFEIVESFVEGHYRESLEREVVCASTGGDYAFFQECKRLEKLRDRTKLKQEQWEPTVVRLLSGDLEMKRKVIA